MNTKRIQPAAPRHRQSGAVLAIGLVMLLVMTLIGLTAMGTSNLEEKMSGNTRDRAIAFQAAESALRHGENIVQVNSSSMTFDTSCTGGMCDCSSTSTICPEYWTDSGLNVWDTSGRHNGYTESIGNVSAQAKYIIEYLGAYVQPLDPACNTCPKDYYRITAIGYGMSPGSKVMLQSTYRID